MYTVYRLKGRMLFAFLAVSVAMLALPVVGQERFGSIGGVVTDPSGALVGDAKVAVTNKATNRAQTATSRADGTYIVPDVEPDAIPSNSRRVVFRDSRHWTYSC